MELDPVPVAEAPAARVAVEAEMVPFSPTAGAVAVQPFSELIDTKVIPTGSTSFSETVCASLGPLFVTVIV